MAQRLSTGKPRPLQVRTSSIKALTVQLSQAIKDLVQGLNRIEALVVETTRHLEDDSDEDNEGDNADETETEYEDDNEDGNGGDGNIDRDAEGIHVDESSKGGTYLCPEEECKGRKADITWKQYVRHYETHVLCRVHCAICPTTSRHVAALKRHFVECPELKQKRHLPEYEMKMYEMKRQRDIESAKASTKAQETFRARKRCLSDLDRSRSRKKARSEKRSETSHQPTEGFSRHHTIIESSTTSPSSSRVGNPPEHCDTAGTIEVDNNLSLVSTSDEVNSITDRQIPYPAIAQLPAHGAAMGTGVLELADPTAILPLGYQQSTAEDVTALAGASNHLATTTDGSAAAAHNQMLPALDSALVVTKALSFGRYTMDGSAIDMTGQHTSADSTYSHLGASSMYYPDNQHSENGAATTQTSSFARHTMDGSTTRTTDQFYAQEIDLPPWLPQGYST